MSKRKELRVVVLYGGKSAEREVSRRTGQQIIQNLDRKKYSVVPLEIATQGSAWVTKLLTVKPDVAVLALHGPFGEDGTVQGMLEMFRIPYTCSGVLASALAMDKFRLCEFVRGQGIRMPKGILRAEAGVAQAFRPDVASARGGSASGGKALSDINAVKHDIGFPCVVKPNRLGSSVGITVNVTNARDLAAALKLGLQHDRDVLVEEYIRGREITAGVLGNSATRALPLIEIVPKIGNFYNYQSKYNAGGSDHIIPAPLSPALTHKIQTLAMRVHTLIGARGVTRSDFILRGTTPYFLEINTIPGMTATSLVPHSAQAAGLSFSKLLDQLIMLARQS